MGAIDLAQIEAVLEVARVVDSKPGDLNKLLPERGQRTAFRGAVRSLQDLSNVIEQAEQP